MRRSPLVIIYLTVFIDLLGFGIILPALPFYAERLGANGFWVGAILTAYSAAQFIGAPILGRISDRIGRRPIILLSLAGSAISLTITGLAVTLPVLILGRSLAGLFGGSIATAQAYIADVTRPEERTKYMGLLGASIGMGFIFGPAIGAGLSRFGFSTAAFVAAGLAAANLLFGVFKLSESRRGPSTVIAGRRPTTGGVREALQHPAISRIVLTMFLATFAFVGLEATYALFGERTYDLSVGGLGLIFAYVGVIIAIVQGGLIGRMSARFDDRKLALSGLILLSLSLTAIPFARSLTAAVVVLGVLALGQGLTTPTLMSLLSLESSAEAQGGTLGIGQSFSAGARAIGPLVAGWLFDQGIALPYFVGAAIALAAAWLIVGVPAAAETPIVPAHGAER